MPDAGDSFTLYLRGGDGAALRNCIKPFGNGGDLDRWKLDAWDAEVILGPGSQVALIRVPNSVDHGSLRTLIIELHQAASEAGLVLSDDVHSKKSPDELIGAFGLESDRAGAMRAGKKSARWSMNQTILFWLLGAGLLVLAYIAFQFVSETAHRMLGGG
ncbi:MAG: hypothetical protein JST54_14865 [Deltaproteobacteria bacterium]|nr:hypothetical protein [Deltaproteobacteria bacterium]